MCIARPQICTVSHLANPAHRICPLRFSAAPAGGVGMGRAISSRPSRPAPARWRWRLGCRGRRAGRGDSSRSAGHPADRIGTVDTEWKVLTGALPAAEPRRSGAPIRRLPAHPAVSRAQRPGGMTLATTVHLFWEWLHRLLARLIGLAFALPWCGSVPAQRDIRRLQATAGRAARARRVPGRNRVVGWFLGLGAESDVRSAHYRLAAQPCVVALVTLPASCGPRSTCARWRGASRGRADRVRGRRVLRARAPDRAWRFRRGLARGLRRGDGHGSIGTPGR